MNLKFHMQYDQTPRLQNNKIQSGREFKMAAITKNSKTIKIVIFSRMANIFGRNFVGSISRSLMLIGIKMKKICTGSRLQWLFENLRRPGHLSPFLQNG